MYDQSLYDRIVLRTRTDEATGCWLWIGPWKHFNPHPGNRYGYLTAYGRHYNAHRAMYIAIHGPQPRFTYICHRCDNPLCVNPDHLFAGSPRDNTHDMLAKNRHNNGKKTHCKRGHEFTPENTIIKPDGSQARWCRICMEAWRHKPEVVQKRRERQQRYKTRKKAERLALKQAQSA